MDNMFEEEKNLKDFGQTSEISLRDTHFLVSFRKVNKLITALYMVTDILDTTEPLRTRLRTLGAQIVSDTHSYSLEIDRKIDEILSLLEIAFLVGMISEMNFNILKREFLALKQSAQESQKGLSLPDKKVGVVDLEKFFDDDNIFRNNSFQEEPRSSRLGIGHTRIGVQKGGTLLKALSDKIPKLSLGGNNFHVLKEERRKEIIAVIKDNRDGLTITDIKSKGQGSLLNYGEKTLQRELVSMVKEGILRKAGEKRWSKYFLSKKS